MKSAQQANILVNKQQHALTVLQDKRALQEPAHALLAPPIKPIQQAVEYARFAVLVNIGHQPHSAVIVVLERSVHREQLVAHRVALVNMQQRRIPGAMVVQQASTVPARTQLRIALNAQGANIKKALVKAPVTIAELASKPVGLKHNLVRTVGGVRQARIMLNPPALAHCAKQDFMQDRKDRASVCPVSRKIDSMLPTVASTIATHVAAMSFQTMATQVAYNVHLAKSNVIPPQRLIVNYALLEPMSIHNLIHANNARRARSQHHPLIQSLIARHATMDMVARAVQSV